MDEVYLKEHCMPELDGLYRRFLIPKVNRLLHLNVFPSCGEFGISIAMMDVACDHMVKSTLCVRQEEPQSAVF